MQEINFIRPQEVYDRNTGESKVRYRSYDGNDRFIPVVDGEKGVPKTMVEVTHAELKAMRDNGKLTAGALYRITDYNCTTTQENTQSAGHQFDIVLLALSEDKLAEEGWAMMHDNDIYDVTFADGVTKKCYFYYSPYVEGNNHYWSYVLVEINTLLGWRYIKDVENALDDFLDKSNKTINLSSTPITSELLNVPNLTYNYFQNSNLSAWKVWYCLDNDKSRFAWADDSVDEGTPASITYRTYTDFTCTRNSSIDKVEDGIQYYGWGTGVFTKTLDIVVGETQCWNKVGTLLGKISAYTSGQEGTGLPNGRGVIYRLIDEWNNDVGYDFKNIQFIRPMTNGEYDLNGEDTWVYTFNWNYNGTIVDATIPDDGGNTWASHGVINLTFELLGNVFLGGASNCYVDCNGANNTIINGSSIILLCCNELVCGVDEDGESAIYINNKKVLTES